MKRFLSEIITLVILTAASLIILELSFLKTKTIYDICFEKLEQESMNIERLNIGNSHIGALMCYGSDSATCFNASFGGQDIFHCLTVLKTCVPHMPKLKTVVLGIDYDLLGYDYLVANEIWKDRQYYPYTHSLYNDDITNRIMASSSFFRSNRDFRVLFSDNSVEVSTPVFIPVGQEKWNVEDCKKRAKEHSVYKFNKKLIAKNLDYLENICKLCKQFHVHLLLVNTPKLSCYTENYDKATIKLTQLNIIKLAAKYKLIYHDYFRDTRFTEDDFINFDHLNKKGSLKLINYLNRGN